MRIFDGPDEVHLASLGRHELTREPTFRIAEEHGHDR